VLAFGRRAVRWYATNGQHELGGFEPSDAARIE